METNNIDTVVDSDSVIKPESAEPGVDEIGTPVESSSSDEAMVAEYESNNEITYYDQQDQENFKTNLLTQGSTGHDLYRQIESDNFINDDGSLTPDTIAAAKANGMSDEDINKHQDSILKNIEVKRNQIFDDAGYAKNRGYISEVISWAKSNFTVEEMNIFTTQTNENPTKSLNALDAYYLRIHNGEEER